MEKVTSDIVLCKNKKSFSLFVADLGCS